MEYRLNETYHKIGQQENICGGLALCYQCSSN